MLNSLVCNFLASSSIPDEHRRFSLIKTGVVTEYGISRRRDFRRIHPLGVGRKRPNSNAGWGPFASPGDVFAVGCN